MANRIERMMDELTGFDAELGEAIKAEYEREQNGIELIDESDIKTL